MQQLQDLTQTNLQQSQQKKSQERKYRHEEKCFRSEKPGTE